MVSAEVAVADAAAQAQKKPAEDDKDLPELELRTYTPQRVLGKGSFGTVYQAKVNETGETVALKSIRMEAMSKRSFKQMNGEKEREVQILKELKDHPNIVCLKGAFLSGVGTAEAKLNLVLEFLSDTLHRVLKHYNTLGKSMDAYYVKLYEYQLLRGLAFAHGKGLVHCDIKPQNLLLDGATHTVKICDFGTAKRMTLNHSSSAYACSRYYRAPELILGSMNYSTAVDLWSAGCVFAEMLIGQPLFTGMDGIDQLVQIVKVIGTPTPADLKAMNPNYPSYEFTPKVEAHPWDKVCRGYAPREATELLDSLLRYSPNGRIPPLHGLLHRYFDDLRVDQRAEHRNLFDFMPEELDWCTASQREKLVPRWVSAKRAKVEQ